MLDTVEEKLASIKDVASIIAGGDAAKAIWIQEGDHTTVLRILAGDKAWAISASLADPAARDQCATYLLRKLANAAHRCPACIKPVARAAPDPKTNKSPVKRYRCESCLHSWQDS